MDDSMLATSVLWVFFENEQGMHQVTLSFSSWYYGMCCTRTLVMIDIFKALSITTCMHTLKLKYHIL